MPLHPSDTHLNRFADGELAGRRQSRVARHLQSCGECRSAVLEIRSLGRSAAARAVPPPPDFLRGRVLAAARRAPAIVPVADPIPRRFPARRLAWLGAGAVLAAVALRLVLAPPELRSEASALEFAPAQPAAGAQLAVTYRATPRFDGIDRLRLRARWRRPGDPQYGRDIPVQEVATLTREDGGTFRGSLALPEDVVYGVFAVEDEAGIIVDSRGQAGWDLLTWIDGLPSYDALVQQTYEAIGRDLDAALRPITRATELYPSEAGAWYGRSGVELETLGAAAHDSLRAFHLGKVRELDLALRDRPADSEDLESMYFYASTWGATDIADRWRARILSEAPASAAGTQLRAHAVLRATERNPRATLRSLEAVWLEAAQGRGVLAQLAFQYARDLPDPSAAQLWASRWLEAEPWRCVDLAERISRVPASSPSPSDVVVECLAAEADALGGPDNNRRALFLSVESQRVVDARRRREVLGVMGRVLLAAGKRDSGLALLDSAVAAGWNLGLISELAEARLDAGDVRGGVELLARLGVDPGYAEQDVTARGVELVGPAEWERLVVLARQRMIDATRAEARPRALPSGVTIRDTAGIARDLRALVEGEVAVVAFFVPGCRACVRDLRRLGELAGRQGAQARVMLVTRTVPSAEDLALLRTEGVDLPVWIDDRGSVAEVLDSWGTAEYFVVDRRGVVQFAYSSLVDIPRQALALGREESPVA